MPLGMVTEDKPLQFSKVFSLMLVTLSGITMDDRPLHIEKAALPISVTLFGMVMEVRVQPSKAELPMLVTLLGITVFLQPTTNVFVAVSIIALHLLRESYFALSCATLNEVRLSQQ